MEGKKVETSTVTVKSLKQELQCAICLSQFKDPRFLPCLHTFCAVCLEGICEKRAKKSSKNDDVISCPLCCVEFPIPPQGNFPSNFFAKNFLNILAASASPSTPITLSVHCDECEEGEAEAVSKCMDCPAFYCQMHSEGHAKSRRYGKHKQMPLNQLTNQNSKTGEGSPLPAKVFHAQRYCKAHPDEVLKLYCLKCEETICRDCTFKLHKDHPVDFISELADQEEIKLKEELKAVAFPLESKVEGLMEEVQRIQKELNKKAQDSKVLLHNHTTQLQQLIEARKREIEAEIEKTKKDKVKALMEQEKVLKVVFARCVSLRELIQTALEVGSPTEVLEFKKQFLQQLKELKELGENQVSHPVEDNVLGYIPKEEEDIRKLIGGFGFVEKMGIQPTQCKLRLVKLGTVGKATLLQIDTEEEKEKKKEKEKEKEREKDWTSRIVQVSWETDGKEGPLKILDGKIELQLEKGETRICATVLGKHINGSPMVLKPNQKPDEGWRWDPTTCNPKLKLSPDRLGVTHDGLVGHAAVVGDTPMNEGVHRWQVTIQNIFNSKWIGIGVCKKGNTNYSHMWGASSAKHYNQMEGNLGKWVAGDVISCTLDFDRDEFRIESRNTQLRVEGIRDQRPLWRIVHLYMKDNAINTTIL